MIAPQYLIWTNLPFHEVQKNKSIIHLALDISKKIREISENIIQKQDQGHKIKFLNQVH